MRTTVDLDAHLLKRLRDEAHRRGIPFKDLLAAAVRRGLDEVARPKARYRCPTFSMGAPNLATDQDRALRLAASMDDREMVRKLRAAK